MFSLDQTFDVNNLIVWLYALLMQALNRPLGIRREQSPRISQSERTLL